MGVKRRPVVSGDKVRIVKKVLLILTVVGLGLALGIIIGTV